MAQSGTSNFPR